MILSYILLMIPPIYHIEDRTIDQAAHFTTILSFVSLIYSGSISHYITLHYLKGANKVTTGFLLLQSQLWDLSSRLMISGRLERPRLWTGRKTGEEREESQGVFFLIIGSQT